MKRVVVFGGNGFVGSHVLAKLARSKLDLVSVSRRGVVPKHLRATPLEKQVQWTSGDALDPTSFDNLLDPETAVVITTGSPPLPTWTEADRAAQRRNNGACCSSVIEAAASRGVSRVVLLGATMPDWAPAGYREGKQDALQAASDFAAAAPSERCAVVLKPSMIYGTRHLESGTPVPLWLLLAPASAVISGLERVGVARALENAAPALFKGAIHPGVDVDLLADCCAKAITAPDLVGMHTVGVDQLRRGETPWS